MRKFSFLMISVALMALVAVGCGGGGKKSITVGDQKVTTGGSVPDAFPKDFPIYGGADFKASITSSLQGQTGLAATWQTGDSIDKVKSYYKDQLTGKSSWVQDSATDTGQGAFFAVHRKSGDAKAGFLTITSQDTNTIFVVFIGDNPDLSTSTSSSADDNKTATADAKTAASDGSSASNTPAAADLPPTVTIAKDFPKDRVPLPSGARVTSTSSLTSGGTSTFFVEVYVKDSPDNVSSYFKDELPKQDWTNALTSEASGTFFLSFSGGTSDSVSITIEQSDTPGYAKASIAVSLTS